MACGEERAGVSFARTKEWAVRARATGASKPRKEGESWNLEIEMLKSLTAWTADLAAIIGRDPP